MVVVPRVVRAGYSYRLVVNVLPPSPSLVVVATLFKDNIQIDVIERECHREEPQLMEISVPSSSTAGHYRLKLEGNEYGWLTGSAFSSIVDLEFSHKGATMIIQTDKTAYKQGTTVRIRILALDLSAKVIQDAVDILILSPRGVIVKRWMSRQCLEGAISLEFPLSEHSEEGKWTIRVEATNSFSEKHFLVHKFHSRRFEVRVESPSFLSSDEEFLRGTVYANYPSGAPVVGNISVRAAWRPGGEGVFSFFGQQTTRLPTQRKNERKTSFWDVIFSSDSNNTRTDQFAGIFEFRFRLSNFDYLLNPSEGGDVLITATVGDASWDTSRTGFSSTKIFSSHIHLQFLGSSPHILRPPMPFPFYITASLQDGSHVSSFRLAKHRLTLSPEVKFKSGLTRSLYPRSIKMTHDQYSLWSDEIDLISELGEEDLEEEVVSLKLEAELKDSLGRRSYASMIAVTHHSPEGKYIQLSTSSKNPKVGEYAIFHVRSNFYFDNFRYILMSKGMIIEIGQERMEASLKTFPLALTVQMAGMSTLVVYVLERGKELAADAVTFPVDALITKAFKVSMEEHPSKSRITVTVKGTPGSKVSLKGTILGTHQMQTRNDLSKAEILNQLSSEGDELHPSREKSALLHMKWISHSDLPEEIMRLPTASNGVDVNETFSFSGLTLLTDGEVPSLPTACRPSRGFYPCLLGGCFSSSSRCNGEWDCIDRIDERKCPDSSLNLEEEISSFKIHRQSWIAIDFAPPWLWNDIVLGDDGKATLSVAAPGRASILELTAFTINPEGKINLLKEPLRITTTPSYWLWVEAPSRVGVWEQVGVRVTVVNRLDRDLPVVVVLANNPNYRFISLEEFEISQPQPSFRARHPNAVKRRSTDEVQGGHRHSIVVPTGEATTLFLPVMPVTTGPLIVTVKADFPSGSTTKSTTIFVESPGALQEKHTSFMLDLTHRAYVFTFLDVQPPSHLPHPQGAKVSLSLFGDVVGGMTQQAVVTTEDTLHLPPVGGESLAFSLWMTLSQLDRWKSLNQKPERNERQVFSQLSLLFQTLLSLQNSDGGFSFFRTSSKSCVWVTAFILRSFSELSQNWSNLLYVDSQVTDKALRFVLKHQTLHGAFFEPSGLLGNRQLDLGSNHVLNQMSTRGLNLSSTALTLIHLHSLKHLPEPLDRELERSLRMGLGWLEDNLELVEEASKPLEVTLVVLALHLLKSKKTEAAFTILARNARQEGEQYVYWGEDLVPLPSYRVEDNRPFLQPRQPHRHDSGNVAATACALRVYASRGELLTPAIVRWLQSQRAHDGGWISTFDTMMAWEALQEYSDIKNKSQNTRLVVTVEPMTELSNAKVFHVTPSNLLSLQTHDMGEKLSSITVQGKGKGAAVLQLNFQYFVSDLSQIIPAPKAAFKIETGAISSGRNASKISFHSCITWTYSSASEASGITVLALTIPTGYGIPIERLEEYVSSRQVPALRSATFRPRLVSFYFDKIGPTDTCVEFSVDRWFPVANLTRILPVKVYEYYSPELFAVELLDMSSITLDICQVCGSYQCPNCPVLSYYSSRGANLRTISSSVFLQPVVVILLSTSIFQTLVSLVFPFSDFLLVKR